MPSENVDPKRRELARRELAEAHNRLMRTSPAYAEASRESDRWWDEEMERLRSAQASGILHRWTDDQLAEVGLPPHTDATRTPPAPSREPGSGRWPRQNTGPPEFVAARILIKALADGGTIWRDGPTGSVAMAGRTGESDVAAALPYLAEGMLDGLPVPVPADLEQRGWVVALEEAELPMRWPSHGLTEAMRTGSPDPSVLDADHLRAIFRPQEHTLPDYTQFEMIRAWLRNVVARLALPGTPVQSYLVLRSLQTGSGKTTAARMLCLQDADLHGSDTFAPHLWGGCFRPTLYTSRGYVDRSRADRSLAGCAWVLMDECAQFLGKPGNVEYLSEMVTATTVLSDQKYVREQTVPAMHTVIGTTQREEFLSDSTGLRRLHVVDTATDGINLELLASTVWQMYVATWHEGLWRDAATRDLPPDMWHAAESGARTTMTLNHWAGMIADILGCDGHGEDPCWVLGFDVSDALTQTMAYRRRDTQKALHQPTKEFIATGATRFDTAVSRREFKAAMEELGFVERKVRWFDFAGAAETQQHSRIWLNQAAAMARRLRKDNSNRLNPTLPDGAHVTSI